MWMLSIRIAMTKILKRCTFVSKYMHHLSTIWIQVIGECVLFRINFSKQPIFDKHTKCNYYKVIHIDELNSGTPVSSQHVKSEKLNHDVQIALKWYELFYTCKDMMIAIINP